MATHLRPARIGTLLLVSLFLLLAIKYHCLLIGGHDYKDSTEGTIRTEPLGTVTFNMEGRPAFKTLPALSTFLSNSWALPSKILERSTYIMRFFNQLGFLAYILPLAGGATAHPPCHQCAPPGPDDFRGPCPMMNTLANHGFLQHDGRNITRENIIAALRGALNFDPALATLMFDQAIIANPEPNATFFTLDHLNQHNVLEHDASLSRSDAFFGNNHIFNQTVFDATKAYWTAEMVTPQMLANSKLFQQIASRASNPEYRFTESTEQFSLGEVAAPVIAFGDLHSGEVNRTLVEFFFENEKLPTELGWSKKVDTVGLQDILHMTQMIANATKLTTDANAGAGQTKRGYLHSGMTI